MKSFHRLNFNLIDLLEKVSAPNRTRFLEDKLLCQRLNLYATLFLSAYDGMRCLSVLLRNDESLRLQVKVRVI